MGAEANKLNHLIILILHRRQQTVYKSTQLRRGARKPNRFQQKWLSEIERHKSALHGSTAVQIQTSQSPQVRVGRHRSFGQLLCPASARSLPPDQPAFNDGGVLSEFNMPPKLAKALKLYRRTVKKRRELDEALVLYHQAFRGMLSTSRHSSTSSGR